MLKFIILFTLLPTLLFGNCIEFNQYEINPSLKNTLPSDQGNFKTCYAQSISQAYYFDFDLKLHPYSIAYSHKNTPFHWKPYNVDYSTTGLAYKDLKLKGACENSVVSNALEKFRVNASIDDDKLLYAIRDFYKRRKTTDWDKKELETLHSMLRKEDSKNFFSFLNKYVNNCRKFYPKESFITFGRKLKSNIPFIEKLNNNSTHNSSLILGYCSHHMEQGIRKNLKPRMFKPLDPSCGAHYALIVGQKEINGSCSVLIRNSHGSSYWGDKNGHCYCRRGESYRDCTLHDFDKSQDIVLGCYYNRAHLLDETFELSYFKH